MSSWYDSSHAAVNMHCFALGLYPATSFEWYTFILRCWPPRQLFTAGLRLVNPILIICFCLPNIFRAHYATRINLTFSQKYFQSFQSYALSSISALGPLIFGTLQFLCHLELNPLRFEFSLKFVMNKEAWLSKHKSWRRMPLRFGFPGVESDKTWYQNDPQNET